MGILVKPNLVPSTRETIVKHTPDATQYLSLKGVSEEVRRAIRVSVISYYGDNVWDLSIEYSDLRPQAVRLNFKSISFDDGSNITDQQYATLLSLAKEYFYSLLVDPPASRPKWSTCCVSVNHGIRYLFRYMRMHQLDKFSDIRELDMYDFQSWASSIPHQREKVITNRTLYVRVGQLSWLYEQSYKLSDGLKVWPFGDSYTENEWCKNNASKTVPRNYNGTAEMPDEIAKQLVLCAIKDLEIADMLVEVRDRREIHAYQYKHTRTPKSQGGYSYRKIMTNPFPWHEYGISDHTGLKTLESRVNVACYILIAMFTGMRVHEILNIKHGRSNNWIVEDIEMDGGLKRLFFVLSMTTKLEANATQYQWQTIPLVEQAIDSLERALMLRYSKGNAYLFASYTAPKQAINRSSMNESLRRYVAHHEISYQGELWNLATHQFRKKFSRIMIRQGLGLKALQDQLKHYDIEMTKVYGDMNLYGELQKEKFCLSEELYEEFLGSQIPIIGGGAGEIIEYRKQFMGMTKKDRRTFLQSLPKKALIEQLDDGLCMYRPQKALCGGDKRNCRPADCNNSVVPVESVKRNLMWRKRENQRMLLFFKNEPLKVKHIKYRNEEIEKLLSQINGNEAGLDAN